MAINVNLISISRFIASRFIASRCIAKALALAWTGFAMSPVLMTPVLMTSQSALGADSTVSLGSKGTTVTGSITPSGAPPVTPSAAQPADPTPDDSGDVSVSDDPDAKCPVISKVLFQPLFKPTPSVDPCVGHGTALITLTDIQRLYLCLKGQSQGSFDVSLGRGGLDKRQTGDCKTPLGVYSLGAPRKSIYFSRFIPIGYPTAEQAANGFTGSAVGIHGPARWLDFLGSLNISLNWTRGCIAVESPEAIDSIANFVRAKKVQVIKIIPPDPKVVESAVSEKSEKPTSNVREKP